MKYLYAVIMTLLMALSIGLMSARFVKSDKNPDSYSVILVSNPDFFAQSNGELAAYQYVLREEGVPFQSLTPFNLLISDPVETAKKHPALIFIDGMNKYVPGEMLFWTKRYMEAGGAILVAYDAGVMGLNGRYLEKAFFEPALGLNYILYSDLKEKAYATANIRFKDRFNAGLFQFAPGKLSEDLYVGGFSYGKLNYPVAAVKISDEKFNGTSLAEAVLRDGAAYPAITYNTYQNGLAMFVNLPIGYLKAKAGDDIWLRSILRAFLFAFIKVPHFINVQDGKGSLAIAWQFEADARPEFIQKMAELKLLRSGFGASNHIAYGAYSDKLEITAERCAPAKATADSLHQYGPIGLLGAFDTKWFNAKGEFIQSASLAEFYIAAHKKCLEEVPNLKILEFSAADSYFPQPAMPKVLSKLSINSYVYSGDSGSQPNAAFYNGEPIITRPKVVSFPRAPFMEFGSFKEMADGGVDPDKVEAWLNELAYFCANNKTVRTVSFSAADLMEQPAYVEPVAKFFDNMELFMENHKLAIKPMSELAEFYNRFNDISYKFSLEKNKLIVTAAGKGGLRGVTLAVPKSKFAKPDDGNYKLDWDDSYYYVRLTESSYEFKIQFIVR